MKKALLPLVIASILPSAAFAEVVVYGKANVALQYVEKSYDAPAKDISYSEVVSNASRIGVKGGESINDDLKAIYQFEYETKVDDGNNSNNQTFAQRNIYVGLQGVGGTGMIGMFDTPLKTSQEKVDLFNDLVGDLKTILEGEVRAKNIVQYSTPTISNFTFNLAVVNAEKDVANAKDGYSASLVYATKELYLALAADQNSKDANSATPAVKDTEILRAVGRVTLGPVVLGAMYQTYDNGTIDEDGFLASVQWNINSDWAVKGQVVQSDTFYKGYSSASIGGDYKLSKATKLFAYYTMIDNDEVAPVPVVGVVTPASKKVDEDYIGVGIELNF
ncbi:MAG TPA: porin [Cellvibrio sp.]|nr:porin [Cellvibrio sp.]